MGRRKQASNLEVAIQIVAFMPWWLGLTAAVGLFLWLHHLASYSAQPPTDLKQLGDYAGHQLWRMYATFGQIIVPGVFLIGAAVSGFKRLEQRERYQTTTKIGQRSALLQMSWQQFEQLVGEHFRQQGFIVCGGGQGGPDGGVDLKLIKTGEFTLVQCKQWRATQVGVDVVRQLYGVMAAEGAAQGFVVTAGKFTPAAETFASGRNIHLLDGEQLIREMRLQPTQTPNRMPAPTIERPVAPTPVARKVCPSCGAAMVHRKASKGPHIGQTFWGCTSFPKCRQVVNV